MAHAALARTPLAPRPGLLRRLVAALALVRSRRALGRLDGHLLRDVGLTAEEARLEAARGAWDAPDRWLR